MFDSFYIALNAILPLVSVMALGIYCRNKGMVSAQSLAQFNKIVFTFCLSISLFKNVVACDLSTAFNPLLIGYCIVGIILIIVISMFILSKTKLSPKQQGVMAQAIYRSNFVILGLPIIESIYGVGNAGVTSIMVAFVVPVLNIAAIFVLQHFAEGDKDLLSSIKAILKNPLIVGALLGVVFMLTGIKVPTLIDNCLSMINRMTTPLALFILGGTFELSSIKSNKVLLSIICLFRLVIIPLIALTGGYLLGFRGIELASLLTLFGGPVAVTSYTMAVQMDMDADLAAQAVLSSTLLVLVTMFCFITGLSMLGLLY